MIREALTYHPLLYLMMLIAFLLGSIPFGIIFTKKTSVDIRKSGSRNIGATNVLRSAGKLPALFTLLGDLLKAVIPVGITSLLVSRIITGFKSPEFSLIYQDLWVGLVGLAAVLGHMFSVFLKFRGGKGVATGFGFLLVYNPVSAMIILGIWALTVAVTKYVSLGAVLAAALLPLITIIRNESTVRIFITVILAILIIVKHKSNMKNIFSGNESKLGGKQD